jgi:hypothetical protein
MANKYVLVNPYISGEFETTINSNNSNEAAKIFYNKISEHFNNAVPKFLFTIQKGSSGNGKYYHYKSVESRKKDDVSFTIKPYTIKGENMNAFQQKLNEFKEKDIQNGGKKSKRSKKSKKSKRPKDSSESDSDYDSSDSEILSVTKTFIPSYNQPIYYWWYDPAVYNLKSFYIPTFYPYITPIIEISMN